MVVNTEPLGSKGTLALGGSRAVVGNYRQTLLKQLRVPECSADVGPHNPVVLSCPQSKPLPGIDIPKLKVSNVIAPLRVLVWNPGSLSSV